MLNKFSPLVSFKLNIQMYKIGNLFSNYGLAPLFANIRYGSREDLLTLDLNNLPEKSNSSTSTTISVNGAEETNGEFVSNTPGMSPEHTNASRTSDFCLKAVT